MLGLIYYFNEEKRIMIFNKSVFIDTYLYDKFDTSLLKEIYTIDMFKEIKISKLEGSNIEEKYQNALKYLVKMNKFGNKY